ncbi:hypothetical protein ACLOJK_005749 [Asimina triloba]
MVGDLAVMYWLLRSPLTKGRLADKHNEEDRKIQALVEGLGKGHELQYCHNPDLAPQNRVLLTTYNYLPSHLKYCFLYCAMFPEDRANEREKIIHMWMGEGFVEEHPRRTLEELADDYFFQPIDRNLLLPVSPIETWRLEECQMHDLMRDGATSTLKKEEFAGIITKQSNSVQEMPRRMALQSKATDVPRTSLPLNARSFLKFCEDEFPSSLLYRTISDFKFLRVLDLEGSVISEISESIGFNPLFNYVVPLEKKM